MDVPQNLQAGTPTLQEDFEVYGDWSISGGSGGPPTITDDTTNYQVGSHSLLYAANGATGNVDVYKTTSFTLANAGTYMEMWLRNSTGANVSIVLFLSATWPTKLIQYNLPIIRDTGGEWVLLRWRKDSHTAPTGGFTYADTITRMTFRFNGSTININLDGLYLNSEAQPAAMFTFDDGIEKTFLNGPMGLERHNAKATLYPVGNYIGTGGYMTAAQLNELIRLGWVVGNHSESHPNFGTLTQAQIETELANCVSDLNAAGVSGHMADVYAAYPNGTYDADVEAAMAAQGFRWGRSVRAQIVKMSMETLDEKEYNASSEQFLTKANFESNIISTVDQAALMIFYNHGVEREVLSGSDISVSMLAQAAAWCVRWGVVMLTADEVWQLRSGPLRVRRGKRRMTAW
jgi:peptidoglycan/xylan/chitin deacetylase (PgdA/CDA1 family)